MLIPDIRKKINSSLTIISFIYIFLFNTCVNEDPPKGGPENNEGPNIIKSYPKDGDVNFKRKKFVFYFDKPIKLDNPDTEIKIIPSLKKAKSEKGYKYSLSKNKMVLTFYLDKALDKNTVYIINFGKAIKSYDGNGVAENLSITFSTGPKLDSIYLKGSVTNIMTGEPLENLYVSLYKYDENNLKTVFDGPPNYFSKTDDKGSFKIEYIKSDKYLLIASDKINFNEEENKDIGLKTLGFIVKPVEIKKNIKDVKLHAVIRENDTLKYESSKSEKGKFEIIFNKPITKYSFTILDDIKKFKGKSEVCSILSEDKKTIKVFNCFYESRMGKSYGGIRRNILYLLDEDKKIKAKVKASDDFGNSIEEQILIYFGDDKIEHEELNIKITPDNNSFIDRDLILKITVNKPILNFNLNDIYFLTERGVKLNLSENNVYFDKFSNELTIKKYLPSYIQGPISFIINKNAFTTIYNDTDTTYKDVQDNDSSKINFEYKIKSLENTGSIKGKAYLGLTNFIVQLLNADFKVVDERRNEVEYEFLKVPEGEYTIRILGLSERRSEWYAGDLKKLKSPDPVFLYYTHNDTIKIIPGIKRTLNSFVTK